MDGQKKLQVNCYPGTLGRICNDPELVENYVRQIMETQGHFDEVVFAPTVEPGHITENSSDVEIFTPIVGQINSQGTCPDESILTPLTEACSDENITGASLWSDLATKLMLDEVKKLWRKVGKSINLKSKNQLWKIIAETLNKEGYGFFQNQVESKFRGLERQYKKAKLNNSKTGRSRMTCVYQSQHDEVFGVSKGINPEFILENEFQPTLNPSSQLESSDSDDESTTSTNAADVAERDDGPSTSRNATKLTERGELLKKLEKNSKREEDRHQKLIEILERRYEERKEREKRREELGKTIIGLLKDVVNNTTK